MPQFIDATGKPDYSKIQKAAEAMLEAFHMEKTLNTESTFAVGIGTISPSVLTSLNNIVQHCKAIVEKQAKDAGEEKIIGNVKKAEEKQKKWEDVQGKS